MMPTNTNDADPNDADPQPHESANDLSSTQTTSPTIFPTSNAAQVTSHATTDSSPAPELLKNEDFSPPDHKHTATSNAIPLATEIDQFTERKIIRSTALISTMLSIVAIIGVLIAARIFLHHPEEPNYLQELSVNPAAQSPCNSLWSHLPQKIGNYQRQENKYLPPTNIEKPVVILCGVDKPAPEKLVNQPQLIDGTLWYTLSSAADHSKQKKEGLIWITANQPIFVAVWIPATAPTSPIQDLSKFFAQYHF